MSILAINSHSLLTSYFMSWTIEMINKNTLMTHSTNNEIKLNSNYKISLY